MRCSTVQTQSLWTFTQRKHDLLGWWAVRTGRCRSKSILHKQPTNTMLISWKFPLFCFCVTENTCYIFSWKPLLAFCQANNEAHDWYALINSAPLSLVGNPRPVHSLCLAVGPWTQHTWNVEILIAVQLKSQDMCFIISMKSSLL